MDALWQDIRFGLRLLLRTPGVLVTAVLALALGIGATSAIFSIVYGVLLKPLPFPEPDRIVSIYDTQPSLKTAPASFPKYVDWRNQNRVFDAIGGASPSTSVLTGAGDAERVRTSRTTASFFRVFAAQPMLGRWFREDEDAPGGAKVAMLSYGFWERRFGGDRSIVGRTITLDDVPRTIVGVMPFGFNHNRADVFVPLAMALDETTRGSHFLPVFGRLKARVSAAQAQREMIALGRRLASEHSNNHGIDVRPYAEAVIGDARRPLLLLLATVGLVLLIACANVANLLLARSAARRKEVAVRAAVGASRARLARQMLTESVMLSIAGGALGLLLAWAGVRAFVATAPPVLPRMSSIALDGVVVGFTLAIALLTGMLFGLAPVLHARGGTFGGALKEETGRATGSRSSRRSGNLLVVVEIALSLILLVSAGLMVKSLGRLEAQDIGVVVERVLAFDVVLPDSRYGSEDKVRAFYRDALERISALPGVVSAGATSGLPLYDFGMNGDFSIEGKTLWKPNDAPLAEMRVVASDYFKTLGVPLVRGRLFTPGDDARARPVIIVNRMMAERFWPNEDPIGKRVKIYSGEWHEIVGVVGSVRSYNPALPPMLEVSFPHTQKPTESMTVVIRASGDPTALTAAIRRQIATIDAAQPVSNVQTMEEVVRTSLSRPRMFSALTSGFAGLAGLLAMIGVYGLIAYAVSQQTREFGIRIAMGANTTTILRLVLARGLKLALAGTAIGAIAAFWATRLMRSMLFNVAPTDPLVFAGACAAMMLAAVAACLVPARAATRVDPVVTLKG